MKIIVISTKVDEQVVELLRRELGKDLAVEVGDGAIAIQHPRGHRVVIKAGLENILVPGNAGMWTVPVLSITVDDSEKSPKGDDENLEPAITSD